MHIMPERTVMKSFLKPIVVVFMLGVLPPDPVVFAQVSLSASTTGNGGATMTGSHNLVATFGQAIIGSSGSVLSAGFWGVSSSVTSVAVEDAEGLPREFSLDQNYPNPFNPTTVISYHMASTGRVSLKIFDVYGREVTTLVNERKPPGTYRVRVDAGSLASGVYLYRLIMVPAGVEGGTFVRTRKMILVR
jgi:Secretion system C-terminal sorting domain